MARQIFRGRMALRSLFFVEFNLQGAFMFNQKMAFAAILSMVVASGCGGGASDKWTQDRPKTVPVTGVLTYKGQPVEGAQINFIPASAGESAAYATSEKDGSFKLTTFVAGDGAAPGSYKVTVNKRTVETILNPKDPNGPPQGVKETSHLPEKYGKSTTSNLQVDVTENGVNGLVLDLTD